MTGLSLELPGIDVDPPHDLMGRIWARDPGAWGPGEDDPAERLGWLDLPERFLHRLDDADELAAAYAGEVDSVLLLGMGGSSLAPEVFARTQPGRTKDLVVADSTHPAEVVAVCRGLDLDRTACVVSSKSGGTIETMSLYRYYRAQMPRGDRYAAITDPATSLARLATEDGFARTFLNPRDIGGRYSALSYFGLVPAVLAGIDVRPVLESARAMAELCSTDAAPNENPALVLGTALAQLVGAGRDKLTFWMSEGVAPFGDWVEQLLAESTGKNGTGIVPVVGEPATDVADYGSDRAFVVLGIEDDVRARDRAAALVAGGHPVIRLEMPDAAAIGGQMFLWELATAVAGALMKMNPFDQPDVESAKKASRAILESGESPAWSRDDPSGLFARAKPGELAVICAFAPRSESALSTIETARAKLLRESGVATMAGLGPRYLHSSGQLHKGGPPGIRALVVLDEPEDDEPIPGEPYGFKDLVVAQAVGDARALADAGRDVARTTWPEFEAWARN
jgi:glucose-6-phosphate isomerase